MRQHTQAILCMVTDGSKYVYTGVLPSMSVFTVRMEFMCSPVSLSLDVCLIILMTDGSMRACTAALPSLHRFHHKKRFSGVNPLCKKTRNSQFRSRICHAKSQGARFSPDHRAAVLPKVESAVRDHRATTSSVSWQTMFRAFRSQGGQIMSYANGM